MLNLFPKYVNTFSQLLGDIKRYFEQDVYNEILDFYKYYDIFKI